MPEGPIPGLSFQSVPQGLLERLSRVPELGPRAPWRRLGGRETQQWGFAFRQGGLPLKLEEGIPEGPLKEMADLIRVRLGWVPDQLLVNRYGRGVGIAPHTDQRALGPTVATVSLLSDTVMEWEKGGRKVRTPLPVGTLCHMEGEARCLWTHGIRPADVTQPRVSLTYRSVRGGARSLSHDPPQPSADAPSHPTVGAPRTKRPTDRAQGLLPGKPGRNEEEEHDQGGAQPAPKPANPAAKPAPKPGAAPSADEQERGARRKAAQAAEAAALLQAEAEQKEAARVAEVRAQQIVTQAVAAELIRKNDEKRKAAEAERAEVWRRTATPGVKPAARAPEAKAGKRKPGVKLVVKKPAGSGRQGAASNRSGEGSTMVSSPDCVILVDSPSKGGAGGVSSPVSPAILVPQAATGRGCSNPSRAASARPAGGRQEAALPPLQRYGPYAPPAAPGGRSSAGGQAQLAGQGGDNGQHCAGSAAEAQEGKRGVITIPSGEGATQASNSCRSRLGNASGLKGTGGAGGAATPTQQKRPPSRSAPGNNPECPSVREEACKVGGCPFKGTRDKLVHHLAREHQLPGGKDAVPAADLARLKMGLCHHCGAVEDRKCASNAHVSCRQKAESTRDHPHEEPEGCWEYAAAIDRTSEPMAG
ncbi:tRNA (carboxymethyluridine(34)-5-O)-methyltransferase [Diplonema papillatum]|nr:tRNA (carboxymethyluridine(34)-5-O)-methyltransferase [Diplonema papillatum]